MSSGLGLSSDATIAPTYAPATSTVPPSATQVRDVSACVITLPVMMLLSVQDVEIYGQLAKSADPLILCERNLPRATLMGNGTDDAAVLFSQDPTDADKVTVTVNTAFDSTEAGAFATNFNTVLQNPVKLSSLDTNTYLWWNETNKGLSTDPNWANKDSVLYRHGSFGKFVLAKIAYDVFGHPLAQAGIANDVAVENDLFSAAGPNGSMGRRLAAAFSALTGPQLQSIYEQLLAQDPSRFNLEDASGGAIGSAGSTTQAFPRSLPFAVNDVIRFEVILDDYNVKRVALNAVTGNTVTTASSTAINSDFSAQNAQSGIVLSTRYAGLKVTVEVKIGETTAPMSPARQAAYDAWQIEKNALTTAENSLALLLSAETTAITNLATRTDEFTAAQTALAADPNDPVLIDALGYALVAKDAAQLILDNAVAAVGPASVIKDNAAASTAAAEAAYNAAV